MVVSGYLCTIEFTANGNVIHNFVIAHADNPENFSVTIGYIKMHSNYFLMFEGNESVASIYPGDNYNLLKYIYSVTVASEIQNSCCIHDNAHNVMSFAPLIIKRRRPGPQSAITITVYIM